MQQEFLDCITFPYDDATRRKLLILYKQKESLFDGEIVQEHLLSQPLLGVFLLLFAILSLGSFVFAIIFIACRALGNCGAKRYQTHPTKGRRYVLFLVIVIISWVGLAGATVHFLTAAVALWNPPIEIEGGNVRGPLHQLHQFDGHIPLQRTRRDTQDKTVRQLFEDSDYVGDFEQLDTTTAPAFVTEEAKTNFSAYENLRQKKLGELKAKRIRYYYGRHTKTSTAAPSSSSPASKYFVIQTKPPSVGLKLPEVPIAPPQYGREPRTHFMSRGIASIKAIRQPFVSDTWSNAGKQAFYRHDLSPSINSSSPSSPFILDNSVTRTEQPDLVLSKHQNAVEVESLLHNFIANDGVEPVAKTPTASTPSSTTTTELVTEPPSTTALVTQPPTTTALITEPPSTTALVTEPPSTTALVTEPPSTMAETSKFPETSTMEEVTEPSSTMMLSETDSTPTTESEDELETTTTTQASESFEETEATTRSEISDERSESFEETDATAQSLNEELFDTSDLPFKDISSTSEWATEPAVTFTETTVQPTTSTSSTTIFSSTTTTSTISLPTAESTTAKTLIKTTVPSTTEGSTTTETEAFEVRTTTAKTFKEKARSDVVEKKRKILDDEEDKPIASKSSSMHRIMQLNSTAAVLQERDRPESKIQRKARFESRSTFPGEKLVNGRRPQNVTNAVMSEYEQNSWAARFFVLFIGIVMVLLTIPTPILVTAGTICYMRSYHPMDRTTFSEKIGQLCVVLATVFLFFSPCLYLYLDVLLAYVHIYFAMCPSIRLLQQFKNLSLDELSMLDAKISGSSNVYACRRNSEAYQGIWASCFVFVSFSIPTVLALFKLSKYYLRMKTEYYWNAGDGYGVIRPKVATTTDAIYGNIYGTLQKKRPGTKPPPRPVHRTPAAEPAAYGVYIEQPTYGVYK